LRIFAQQGWHVAPMGVKFGTEERTEGPLLRAFGAIFFRANFHPHWCNDKGIGPPKLKFVQIFDQNVEYKRPAVAYSLRDFRKICRICTSFQVALAVKVSLDLLKGLWSYGDFNLTGYGYPHIFSAPSGKTMRHTAKRFRGARTCSRSSITMPSLVWLGFHPPPAGGEKRWVFCLSIMLFLSITLCLSVTLLNVRVCSPDFAMKALENRNDFDAVG